MRSLFVISDQIIEIINTHHSCSFIFAMLLILPALPLSLRFCARSPLSPILYPLLFSLILLVIYFMRHPSVFTHASRTRPFTHPSSSHASRIRPHPRPHPRSSLYHVLLRYVMHAQSVRCFFFGLPLSLSSVWSPLVPSVSLASFSS